MLPHGVKAPSGGGGPTDVDSRCPHNEANRSMCPTCQRCPVRGTLASRLVLQEPFRIVSAESRFVALAHPFVPPALVSSQRVCVCA